MKSNLLDRIYRKSQRLQRVFLAAGMVLLTSTAYSAPVKVACVGDSITQGPSPAEAYPARLQRLLGPEWQVGNFGYSGSTLLNDGDRPYQKGGQFQRALAFQPDVVTIMLGTNDSKPQNWKLKSEFVKDYQDLIKKLQDLPSHPKIYLCLPPTVFAEGNYGINEAAVAEERSLIRQLAVAKHLPVIDNQQVTKDHADWFPDRVHPDARGTDALAGSFYHALTGKVAPAHPESAWEIGPFVRPVQAQPVITPDPQSTFQCPMRKTAVHWEATHTFNPAAVARDGKVYLLYRSEDDQGSGIGGYTSRLGLAWSEDGVNFTRHPEPVFFPAEDSEKDHEWFGGCEDPRVVELADGTYALFYTQYRRVPGQPRQVRLGMAVSKDLLHWEKKGAVVIKDDQGRETIPSKSASPLTTLANGRLIAAKVNGRYWMYYGEGAIRVASSPDLQTWKAEGGVVLAPRRGCFDSGFPEAGPPAVLTPQGIVFLYNGKNAAPDRGGDVRLKGGVYCGGQALFDAENPTLLLDRPAEPFFKPELPWEATGQYGAGTTFIEGLVFFKGHWLLYYGCADSFVGVAMASPAK